MMRGGCLRQAVPAAINTAFAQDLFELQARSGDLLPINSG
jgi:hypothetical protein